MSEECLVYTSYDVWRFGYDAKLHLIDHDCFIKQSYFKFWVDEFKVKKDTIHYFDSIYRGVKKCKGYNFTYEQYRAMIDFYSKSTDTVESREKKLHPEKYHYFNVMEFKDNNIIRR